MKKQRKVFSAFTRIPESLISLLEIVGLPIDSALEAGPGGARISFFSESSFDEAEERLLVFLNNLRKFAENNYLEELVIEREILEESQYMSKYMEYLKPFRVKDKLIIFPGSCEEDSIYDGSLPAIFIESLFAFGTGAHPTTRLCLDYLAEAELRGKVVIDAGTGSGILAIAAARLGADKVYAFDIDQLAVDVASKNVKINGVEDRVSVFKSSLAVLKEISADLIIANLTSEIIMDNLRYFAMPEASEIVFSGILKKEIPAVLKALHRLNGYKLKSRKTRKDWSLIVLTNG
jgi:ribosomal protein L11 methyltransferase